MISAKLFRTAGVRAARYYSPGLWRLVAFPHPLGQEPVFTDYPETSLTLTSTTVLDSRLVVCEYRPKTPA